MDSLKPQTIFPIVRGITDHNDTGTYYIQAVIKRAADNSILDTVNLVDQGERYFSKNWTVPADVSGEGFYISITTSVYTDAEHTTKAENYGDEFETYLIADRPTTAQILGGGGSGGISYKKLREIVTEVVTEAISGMPKPIAPKEIDFSMLEGNLLKELSNIINKIESIRIPESEKLDYEKINNLVADHSSKVFGRVDEINIPEFDYNRLEDKIQYLQESLSTAVTKLEETFSKLRLSDISELSKYDKRFDTLRQAKDLLASLDYQPDKEEKKEETKKIPWYKGGK